MLFDGAGCSDIVESRLYADHRTRYLVLAKRLFPTLDDVERKTDFSRSARVTESPARTPDRPPAIEVIVPPLTTPGVFTEVVVAIRRTLEFGMFPLACPLTDPGHIHELPLGGDVTAQSP